MGQTLVQHCPFSKLGTCHRTCLFPNSEPAEPGFGSVLSPNSEPARVWSSEKGTCLSPNYEPAEPGKSLVHAPNSKPAEPRFGLVLSPNLEHARIRSSEKGTGLSPNTEPVELGSALSFLGTPNLSKFGAQRKERAFLRTPNLPNNGYPNYESAEPGLTRSNSELKLQTLGKNTILDHLG